MAGAVASKRAKAGNRARRRLPVRDKRAAILDAAVTLFADRGFHGTNVPDIARLAGVATGSIYRYFATKEALVNAAIVARKQAMAEVLARALATQGGSERQFLGVWRAVIAFARANPTDFRFLEMHHHESYLDAACRRVGDKLMRVALDFLREARGARDAQPPGPEALFGLVWGALVGLVKRAEQGAVRLDPATVDATGLAMWRAIAGSPPARANSTSPTTKERILQ